MSLEPDKDQDRETGVDRFYFDESRFNMTVGGRLFVRISTYIGYLVLAAAAFSFAVSDVKPLRVLGIFFCFFLVDRFLHWSEGDRPFSALPRSGKINLASCLSPAAYAVLEKAFDRSALTGRDFFLETLKALLEKREIQDGLRRLDVKPEEFGQKLEDFLGQAGGEKADKKILLEKVREFAVQAGERSLANNRRFIEPTDLFSALFFAKDEKTARLFNMFSIEVSDLELSLLLSSLKRRARFRIPSGLGGFAFESQRKIRHRVMNRAWTSRPTPTLDKFSTDFTDLAREGAIGFLVGHEAEYQRLADTVSRPINPNALLVGEEGIGKEAVVMHLARNIAKDEVPPPIFDKRLVSLDINGLLAGADPAELQSRLKKVVEEIFMAGNVILYIPDIHNLIKSSGEFYVSAADALMPVIKNNSFPVIGSTYPREFRELIEPRSDVTGIFEIVRINEVSEAEARKVLVYDTLLFERKTGIVIGFGAIKSAVTLAKKYLAGKFLPSSAEELLKDAMAIAQRSGEKFVGREEIVEAAEKKVNIPIHEAGEAESQTLLHLEDDIHKRLIDQEEAVKSVSDALREYRSGLNRKGGPIATFLFVGPTGVGKTELAKILSQIQFGSEKMMLRFDMTEYQDKQSFYRFIGSPDGQTRGALTEAVLQKPYSLVLLDEFEKAFPDILNLFLQVFDDGRLTDNLGRTVSFENTVIIATSNAHSDIINEALSQGEGMGGISEYLKRKLVDVFKPELLNRFSKIVVFKDLSPDDVAAIAALNLKDLSASLAEQGIVLSFDDSALREISRLGYDPAFGARPLRRAIEENLRSPLAEKILAREVVRGSRTKISFAEGKFQFEVSQD